ncbi:MAG TPA: hypothetical protein GXZ48_07345 [Acholeplasmataceae bacterium]|nr:hypothetical protein [Acholeplasmataceae bacterium]
MNTFKIKKRNTKMIAHRGLSGLEKENTISAFVAAGNRSYYGIECDVHKTKDGIFVIIHDDNTKRISCVDKKISECTYEELLQVNINDVIDNNPKAYLKIPTFIDYLDICLKYRKHCIIELKGRFYKDDIEKLINIIESRNYIKNVTFISFTFEYLIDVRKINNQVSCQFLTAKYTPELLNLLTTYQMDLDIHYEAVTKDLIKELHDNNILINIWTVNDPVIGEKLASWGADYITTDILE